MGEPIHLTDPQGNEVIVHGKAYAATLQEQWANEAAEAEAADQIEELFELDEMTKAQLLELAEVQGVEVSSRDTKAEIIEALNGAE